MRTMKNRLYLFSIIPFILIACIGEKVPPADIYTLSPIWNDNKPLLKQSNKIIKLAPIRATRSLTSTQIHYKDSDYGLNSYVYSQWNDSPVKLLQTFFQVNIDQSKLFKAVLPAISVSKADLILESTLLDFTHHIKNDKASEGVIRIRFYLIDNVSNTVISTSEFVAKEVAVSVNAQGGVEALNKASITIGHQLIEWLAGSSRF